MIEITAKRSFNVHGKMYEINLTLHNVETITDFKDNILGRALNCGESLDITWLELYDKLDNKNLGPEFYKQRQKFQKAADETQALILNDPLPICSECGQKGYGHYFNCPVLLKK